LLKPRHARWAELLSLFSFKIFHIRGKDNTVADALSRPPLEDGQSMIKEKEILLGLSKWNDSQKSTSLSLLDVHMPPLDDINSAFPESTLLCSASEIWTLLLAF
jgi:hypothetical protein